MAVAPEFQLRELFEMHPGAMPVIDPELKEYGRLWIRFEHLESTKALRRWMSGVHTQPSLCMLFQNGQCNGGPKCNQAHVRPEYVTQVRTALKGRAFINCCLAHGDLPSWRRDFQALLRRRPVQLKTDGGAMTLRPEWLAISGYFTPYLTDPGTGPIVIDASRVCNLHQLKECKYGADCRNVHVCRELWSFMGYQPKPRPKSPELGATASPREADPSPAAPVAQQSMMATPMSILLPAGAMPGSLPGSGSIQLMVAIPLQASANNHTSGYALYNVQPQMPGVGSGSATQATLVPAAPLPPVATQSPNPNPTPNPTIVAPRPAPAGPTTASAASAPGAPTQSRLVQYMANAINDAPIRCIRRRESAPQQPLAPEPTVPIAPAAGCLGDGPSNRRKPILRRATYSADGPSSSTTPSVWFPHPPPAPRMTASLTLPRLRELEPATPSAITPETSSIFADFADDDPTSPTSIGDLLSQSAVVHTGALDMDKTAEGLDLPWLVMEELTAAL